MSNRVIRKFIDEEGFPSESFLRLQIGDENGKKLFAFDLTDVVVNRIKRAIINGITINGTPYFFLAYSSSQLKEGSVWMVSPINNWTVTKMRASMGDFSCCKTASKYAARMGQCFSTTFQGTHGCDAHVGSESFLRHFTVPDISSANKDVPHSDGNGLISKTQMQRLLRKMPNTSENIIQNTSIVQIRYGGAKGVLVAWDQRILTRVLHNGALWNTPCDVLLRNSMIKFDAKFRFLEVCRIGTKVPYYLNRSVILLLGTHGIRNTTFLSLQKTMLQDLETMLHNREKAMNMIPRLGGPDQSQRMRLLHMLYSGMSPDKDPFLFSCCVAIRSHHLTGLRKKARIFIENGAVLVGGIDETKLLPEYCVFVQVQKDPLVGNNNSNGAKVDEHEFRPIVGPVLVTKHPVMHPGDVRMLLAVDIPELRQHKNVILFSQIGDRPETNKMSGSDLDGDEYAVTWDPRLFLGVWNDAKKKDLVGTTFVSNVGQELSLSDPTTAARILNIVNADPLDYTAPASATPTDGPIGDTELVDHIISYTKNDCLGPLSMMWQDWAAEKGADCSQCIELAKLHSIAVDFAKSGVAANLPAELRWKGGPAHWREKKDDTNPRHCTSVIGQLYDAVILQNDSRILKQFPDGLAGRKVNRYGQIVSEINEEQDLEYYLLQNYQARIPALLGWNPKRVPVSSLDKEHKAMLFFANEQRMSYEFQITEIMNKYCLKNEGELFTGCIRKYHKLHKKRQHEVSEEVRRQCSEVCKEYRAMYFREVLEISETSLKLDNLTLQFSSVGLHHIVDGENKDDDNDENNKDDNDSESDDDDDDDKEKLVQIEKLVTSSFDSQKNKQNRIQMDFATSQMILAKARKLAAAYYVSTYSPSFRENDYAEFALFSFPWIIADVIACGLNKQQNKENDRIVETGFEHVPTTTQA